MNNTTNKKVLLIEDDSAIIDIYETIMKKNHLDVDVVSSGNAALERIKNLTTDDGSKPDIILLDLILPDINGMDVFKVIKENAQTKDISVFIMTNQEDSTIEWPNNIRPDKYLIKANTSPAQLVELIKEQLKIN